MVIEQSKTTKSFNLIPKTGQ